MRAQDLKTRRAIAGLTIKELANVSGVSAATIGRIERGYRGATPRILKQLERALEDPHEELLEAAKRACAVYEDARYGDWMRPEMDALRNAIQNYEARRR